MPSTPATEGIHARNARGIGKKSERLTSEGVGDQVHGTLTREVLQHTGEVQARP